MKKLTTLLLVSCVFITLTSCANSNPITTAPPPESIEFFGETYLISEANYTTCDEDGNINFVLFHDIGFIGLADKNKEPMYQQVKPGQVIGDATVTDGINMGFDLINEKWELTESDVSFTGTMIFIGDLTKTPEGTLDFLAPGTLTFTVTDSESGFIPFKYGFDNAPQFMLDGYNPEVDYPELFSESDTVYVRATFDSLRLFKTERATGVDRAKLVSVELLDKSE